MCVCVWCVCVCVTCASGADDAVVNVGATVHRDLQAVVGVVVLG